MFVAPMVDYLLDHAHRKHGNESKEAKAEGSTKFRGRKPIGFENLNLNDPDQLAIAIIKSLSRK
jgi:hypothetical protein